MFSHKSKIASIWIRLTNSFTLSFPSSPPLTYHIFVDKISKQKSKQIKTNLNEISLVRQAESEMTLRLLIRAPSETVHIHIFHDPINKNNSGLMMSGSLVTRDEISQSPTPCSYAKTAEDIKSSAQDFQKLRPSREKEVKGFHCDVSDREIDRGKDGESGAKVGGSLPVV